MPVRPRIARKLLVASVGVASLSYVACDKPAASPPVEVATPAMDAAAPMQAPSASAPPAFTPSAPEDAGSAQASVDAGAKPPGLPRTLVFRVTQQGRVELDGTPISHEQIAQALQGAKAAGPTTVRIVTDAKAPQSAVLEILDRAKKEGLPVSLGSLQPPSTDLPPGNLMAPMSH
jgi:biopolymer transport protein ExbD